jgi:hypothetical protein
VHSILETCNLPTSYLDSLPAPSPSGNPFRRDSYPSDRSPDSNNGYSQEYYWNRKEDVKDVEDDISETASAQDANLRYNSVSVNISNQKLGSFKELVTVYFTQNVVRKKCIWCYNETE